METNLCKDCEKICYKLIGKCWKCFEKDKINFVMKRAKEYGYTSGEKYICCPYCGEHYGEDDIHKNCYLICDSCNKLFNVKVEYNVTYTTEKTSEDKE